LRLVVFLAVFLRTVFLAVAFLAAFFLLFAMTIPPCLHA
jgi:hypothetical protein